MARPQHQLQSANNEGYSCCCVAMFVAHAEIHVAMFPTCYFVCLGPVKPIRTIVDIGAFVNMPFSALPFKGLNTFEDVTKHYRCSHRIYGILFSQTMRIAPIKHLDLLRTRGSGVYSGTTPIPIELRSRMGGMRAIITTHKDNYIKFLNGTKMIEFSCKKLYGKVISGGSALLQCGQRVGIVMSKDTSRSISVMGVFEEHLGPFTHSNDKVHIALGIDLFVAPSTFLRSLFTVVQWVCSVSYFLLFFLLFFWCWNVLRNRIKLMSN